jgi:hypothetical protein
MEADNLQQAWQSPASHSRLAIDADLLLQEVQRKQRAFRATVFWRDFREIGVALVLVLVWIAMGLALDMPWSWYLTVPALIGVAGFLLVDRLRHRRAARAADQPLRQHVELSLAEVEHQIWLLRNVFWWYLLPFLLPMFAFLLHLAWLDPGRGLVALSVLGVVAAIIIATFGLVHRINQLAVRTHLEPRRQELKSLLAALVDAP